VYEAYKAVKSNKGAAGVDGQTIEQFDQDLRGNLYKIWGISVTLYKTRLLPHFPPNYRDSFLNPRGS
jgi:retron-type reverse transcriptase